MLNSRLSKRGGPCKRMSQADPAYEYQHRYSASVTFVTASIAFVKEHDVLILIGH